MRNRDIEKGFVHVPWSVGILAAGLLAWVFTSPAFGQVLYGTITGNVTDTSGAYISGATVTALSTNTGVQRIVTTNNEGIYLVQDIQPGNYTITITAANFAQYR